MKIFTAAAIAILISSGTVFAQNNNSGAKGSDPDPANYLKGPKTQEFYTDDTRANVRPPAEFKRVWDRMNDADRGDVRQACAANRDVSYNPLCTNVKAM